MSREINNERTQNEIQYINIHFNCDNVACRSKVTTRIRGSSNSGRFNVEKDLLLAQFDCKTDVDDLHSAAALSMLLSNSNFSKVKYHAVAGTYGIQEGLYVPPNELFQLAFGKNWTDAHENVESAIKQVKSYRRINARQRR